MSLPDIRSRFTFHTGTLGGYVYKEASGELGVPGRVMTHRNPGAQRAMAQGTGEHAGHLIGVQFGAPGNDPRNMSLQNANINTFARTALHDIFKGSGDNY